jgi:hypothetical protein
MLTQDTYKFKGCNNHLLYLFEALKSGDVQSVYKIEHELTPTEECVACAYALKVPGEPSKALINFLRQEGFAIANKKRYPMAQEIGYWMTRLVVFGGFFAVFLWLARLTKYLLLSPDQAQTVHSFGIIGAFILAVAAFVFFDIHVVGD